MLTDFVHGEAELAEATGLSEKNLRGVRAKHLRQGTHWGLQAQHVVYSATGVQLVLEQLSGRELQPEELRAALEGSRLAMPEKKEPPLIGKVFKTFPNPRLLGVQLASGTVVNVGVKLSKNFRRGMEVPIRVNPISGKYELARKLPRFPGKW